MISTYLVRPYAFRFRAAVIAATLATIFSFLNFPFQNTGSYLNRVEHLDSNGVQIVSCIQGRPGFNTTYYDLQLNSPSRGELVFTTQRDDCANWTSIYNAQVAVLDGSVIGLLDGKTTIVSVPDMMSTIRIFAIFLWVFLLGISFSYLDEYFGPGKNPSETSNK